MQVFDIYGKMVMQQNTTRMNTQLNVAAFSAGVYMIKVMNDGKESTLKIVKD